MVVKEYDYIKGNTALNPKRNVKEKENKKYDELKRSKKNHKRRIQEQKRKTRATMFQISLFILVMGVITIARDSQVFTMQKELTSINNEIKEYQAENEALEVDLLKSSSLDNIKDTAESELKMTIAKKENIAAVDLSQNYFRELDKKDKSEKKESKGIINKVLDALK